MEKSKSVVDCGFSYPGTCGGYAATGYCTLEVGKPFTLAPDDKYGPINGFVASSKATTKQEDGSLVSSELPPGLSLNGDTGVISGTPTSAPYKEYASLITANCGGGGTLSTPVTFFFWLSQPPD